MQSPEARADRVKLAADRLEAANRLRSMPKEARRAITVAANARRDRTLLHMGETARRVNSIDEGRIRLASNYRKRKGRLSAGEVGAITRAMAQSAQALRQLAAR